MPKEQQPTFEQAMESLEKIVEQMEADTLPLEELLVRYEEGLKLVKICGEKLEAAEKRIEIISKRVNEKPKAVEFDPGAQAGGATAPSTGAKSSVIKEDSAGTGAPSGDVRLF